MIIGRGLLGNALSSLDNDELLFYVNGISNSSALIISENNYEKNELQHLAKNHQDKTLVYFSTCMVNSKTNSNYPYVNHKNIIESFTENNFNSYLIVRTSNLVGKNPWNNNTLFNYLANAIKTHTPIIINKRVIRNILDVSDLVKILAFYLKSKPQLNRAINLVYPISYTMEEIVEIFEDFFLKKFVLKQTSKEIFSHLEADLELSIFLFSSLYPIDNNYLKSLLQKYYIN